VATTLDVSTQSISDVETSWGASGSGDRARGRGQDARSAAVSGDGPKRLKSEAVLAVSAEEGNVLRVAAENVSGVNGVMTHFGLPKD